jgi:hypothetical protein
MTRERLELKGERKGRGKERLIATLYNPLSTLLIADRHRKVSQWLLHKKEGGRTKH